LYLENLVVLLTDIHRQGVVCYVFVLHTMAGKFFYCVCMICVHFVSNTRYAHDKSHCFIE